MIVTLTGATFENEVVKSEKTVLVDFWAPWCGPCKMLAPTIDEIADENPDIKVCKVNVDDEQELAMRFGVMAIPTLIVFKGGNEVERTMGVKDKEQILSMVK